MEVQQIQNTVVITKLLCGALIEFYSLIITKGVECMVDSVIYGWSLQRLVAKQGGISCTLAIG